ncbi:MAG TPA: MarR family winged helix-turn-helix transcriptional regulator [Puia sp.]|nr:MarR family winged helix-turn-helix transcriptional regulator [Puia sp.]
MEEEIARILDYYPKIYFACHTRHVFDKDKDVKLTAHQMSVLGHLEPDEPIALFDLAMHMGVTPSTMSITIERLLKLGYVERVRDKKDARKISLTLSRQGAKIKRKHSVLDPELVASLLLRLSEKEKKIVLDGLGLLAYASEMEMKAKSLGKAWNNRNP